MSSEPIPPHILAQAAAAAQNNVQLQARGRVAVVGGGIAGLTAAYRLMQQGFEVTVYEADTEIGGHARSHEVLDNKQNPTGLFVDLGGEVVEENSHLQALCEELGVPLLRRDQSKGEQLYYANGRFLTKAEIAEGYAPLATIIEDLRGRIHSQDPEIREQALNELRDTPTIESFIDKHAQAGNVSADMATVLKQAYISEIGRQCHEQDVLNLVMFTGTDPRDFDPYAATNENLTYQYGASSLVDALKERMHGRVNFVTSTRVTSVDASGETVKVGASSQDRTTMDGEFDHIVMAGSLPNMRNVKGIETLGLNETQMEGVKNMQYTQRTKVVLFVRGNPWKDIKTPDGQNSDGSFITDGIFQASWIARDTQPAIINDEEVRPITLLLGGDAANMKPSELLTQCKAELCKMTGKQESELFVDEGTLRPIVKKWVGTGNECDLCTAPGQYNIAYAMAEAPANAKVSLAGSYMPVGDQMGFMHCASQSGDAAAQRIAQMHMARLEQMEQQMVSQYQPQIIPQKQEKGWMSWLGF